MYPTYQESFTIKSYEVDFADKLKLSTMFRYFQEAAYNHVESYGLGYQGLKDHGLFWVLSRIKVVMNCYPIERETIRIETWPKAITRLAAVRDFEISDPIGRIAALATTQWLVLDQATKKPQRISVLPYTLPIREDKQVMTDVLDKLKPSGMLEEVYQRRVMVSDLDVNRHVNNAKYADWIMDCFPLSQLEREPIRSLQINYLAEAEPDDRIVLRKGRSEEGVWYIEGVREGNIPVFNAEVTL